MEKEAYSDEDVILLLLGMKGVNDSSQTANNGTDTFLNPQPSTEESVPIGVKIYAYLIPLIIIFGLAGNIFALVVYVMPQMRQFGICLQLAAIAISDSLVLLIYVFPEWLAKGLPLLGHRAVGVIHIEGVCQAFLFLSYVSRAVSAWLLASFSVQQCSLLYGCCGTQQRSPTRSFALWMVGGTLLAAILASVYKPILSGIDPKHRVCGTIPDHSDLSFVLDITFGLSISALTCVIITIANAIILFTFVTKGAVNTRSHLHGFSVTIIVTTLVYVCLNVPYFIIWIQHYVLVSRPSIVLMNDLEIDSNDFQKNWLHLHNQHSHLSSDVYVTRMLFYINFAVKALLYGITAKRFRQQTRLMCKGQGQTELDDLEEITMDTPGTIAN